MKKRAKIVMAWLALVAGVAATTGAVQVSAIDVVSAEQVSKSTSGDPADRSAFASQFTPDGRYAVYFSTATNLGSMVPPANAYHTYLYDRQLQTTELITINTNGQPAQQGGMPLGISDDGRFVFFVSGSADMPNYPQSSPMNNPSFIYMRDRQAGVTTRVGSASFLNMNPSDHSVSGDGTLLAFQVVTQYTAPDNMITESYIYNRVSNTLITLPSGASGIQLSANGQFAGYKLGTQLYRYTIATGASSMIADDLAGFSLSPDGSHLIGAKESSNGWDILYIEVASANRQLLYSNSQGYSQMSFTFDRVGKRVAFYIVSQESIEVASKAFVVDVTNSDQAVVDTGLHKAPGMQLSADGSELLFSSFTRRTQTVENHQVFVAKLRAADTVPPVVSNLTVTPRLILLTGTMTISANATDSQSGVAGGEYYIDTDPGQGGGTSMAYTTSTGKLSATRTISFGSLTPGIHTLFVRAVDASGNWSKVVSKTFLYL